MNENKIITEIEQLTPEWLTLILKNKGYLSQGKVTKILEKKSQEVLTSHMYFLDLKFSTDAQKRPSSSEIVVKITKLNDEFKIFGRQEAKFYAIIAQNMIGLPIPTCYDAKFSDETGLSHIILEDISKTHATLSDYPLRLIPSKYHFEKAIDSLAEIHAFWWDHKDLEKLSKQSRGPLTLFLSMVKEEVFECFLEDIGDKMSANRKSLLKAIFSLFPQVVYERIVKKNLTLIHNDAHLGQFFYPKDKFKEKYKTILGDWQGWNIGLGSNDLAYMIGLNLFPDYRHLIEENLIRRYYNHLEKSGIKNYSWDDCWYDYKLSNFLNIYTCIRWWKTNMVSPFYFWVRLQTSISTIEDLNCMDLLES